jgi:hypothetical protein
MEASTQSVRRECSAAAEGEACVRLERFSTGLEQGKSPIVLSRQVKRMVTGESVASLAGEELNA